MIGVCRVDNVMCDGVTIVRSFVIPDSCRLTLNPEESNVGGRGKANGRVVL